MGGKNATGISRPVLSRAVVLYLSLALLFAAIVLGGMSPAAPAALFSVATMFVVIAAVASRPQESIARAASAIKFAALFWALYLLFAIFSASVLSASWAHPFWKSFALAGPLSIAPFRVIEGASASISQAGFAFLGALCVDERTDRDRIGRALIALSLALAAMALIWLFFDVADDRRLRLRLDSANAAATMFGMLALCAMTLWIRAFQGRFAAQGARAPQKLAGVGRYIAAPVSLAAFVFCIACLIMTASRGGMLATIVALITLLALISGSVRKSASSGDGAARPLLALAGVALGLVLIGGDLLFSRFESIGESSNQDRKVVIETHWRAFMDRPVLGHGINSFHELNSIAANPENWRATRIVGSAHNIFVQALEEGGLIGGGLIFAAFGALIMSALWRALNAQSGREWAAAAFAASLLALLHGLVDFGLNVPAISALLCFILGAFTVGVRKNENAPAGKSPAGAQV